VKLAALPAPDFDLAGTLNCGQVFHWTETSGEWTGLIGTRAVRVHQEGASLIVPAGTETLCANYFALDHPLRSVYRSFPRDAYSQAALKRSRGIRILRQPLWECLATFLFSSMKQVPHIRQISFKLRERFGEPVRGSSLNAFPSPERLAETNEAALRECALGFRAANLRATAGRIANGDLNLESLRSLPTPELRAHLMSLPGVGEKIANCALLFAYERLDSVPVDVWIARILRGMIGQPTASLASLQLYADNQFGRYAGYIQQYLFHYARASRELPGC